MVFAVNLIGKEARGGEKPAHYDNFFHLFPYFHFGGCLQPLNRCL